MRYLTQEHSSGNVFHVCLGCRENGSVAVPWRRGPANPEIPVRRPGDQEPDADTSPRVCPVFSRRQLHHWKRRGSPTCPQDLGICQIGAFPCSMQRGLCVCDAWARWATRLPLLSNLRHFTCCCFPKWPSFLFVSLVYILYQGFCDTWKFLRRKTRLIAILPVPCTGCRFCPCLCLTRG